jgi:phage terminase large subunit-like protein
MTEYNFTAQYQQDPQPPSGIIVKKEWLTFYGPRDLPEKFDQIVQSWDTANKDSELADFSVCTTWGIVFFGFSAGRSRTMAAAPRVRFH